MRRKFLDLVRLIWKLPFLESCLVNMTEGRVFGTWITKLPPNYYQYSMGSVRLVNRNGINYKLDISDIIDWYIYFGFVETSRVSLYEMVKEGDLVLDVGANVGDVAMNVAKRIGENGAVHAFEPDKVNYLRFLSNLNHNRFENIVANQIGLGDKPGQFEIYNVDENNRGKNRILTQNSGLWISEKIQVNTLDKYVEEQKIEKIDLIKIDVEGFEIRVLLGSIEVISRDHPKLFIELDDTNLKEQGGSARELISILIEFGYDVFHAETKVKIKKETDFLGSHFDIIAV